MQILPGFLCHFNNFVSRKLKDFVVHSFVFSFGFTTQHMCSETEAQEAVTQLDSTNFMGNLIKVQFSTTDVHKVPGVGSKGECFKCGSKGHLSRDCDR